MSSTKRGTPLSNIDKKKFKAKRPRSPSDSAGLEENEHGGYEESAEGSHLDDEIQLANSSKGSWDWNHCFILDCRRNSDR